MRSCVVLTLIVAAVVVAQVASEHTGSTVLSSLQSTGELACVVQTSGSSLRFRDAPMGNVLGKIPHGAKVEVPEWKVTEKGGFKWVMIRYNGQEGFAASEFIQCSDDAPPDEESPSATDAAPDDASAGDAEAEAEEADEAHETEEGQGGGVHCIVGDSVNVRHKPGGDKAFEILGGSQVALVEDFGPALLGGRTYHWVKIIEQGGGGRTGYIAKNFLSPICALKNPEIFVSLKGLTVELVDKTMDPPFHEVYPCGVGTLGRNGKPITPVGDTTTGPKTSNGWYYIVSRTKPAYFGGFPFLRLMFQNSRGANTYGLHGPITQPLKRGYVSHGCMRMRGGDITRIFNLVKDHASTPVRVQEDFRMWEGKQVDVAYPRHHEPFQ